jgi:hypothetical protein
MFNNFFSKIVLFMRMWKYIVRPNWPQMTVYPLRIACWIPKATNTHSECVILIAISLQQWLHERATLLRYTYIVCLYYHSTELLQ